jgi:hypothetical protein
LRNVMVCRRLLRNFAKVDYQIQVLGNPKDGAENAYESDKGYGARRLRETGL